MNMYLHRNDYQSAYGSLFDAYAEDPSKKEGFVKLESPVIAKISADTFLYQSNSETSSPLVALNSADTINITWYSADGWLFGRAGNNEGYIQNSYLAEKIENSSSVKENTEKVNGINKQPAKRKVSTSVKEEYILKSGLFSQDSTLKKCANGEFDLKKGNDGVFVEKVNKALQFFYPEEFSNQKSFTHFNKHTKNAVKRFQIQSGLPADGILGNETMQMLDEYRFMEKDGKVTSEIGLKQEDVIQFKNSTSWLTDEDDNMLHIISGEKHYLINLNPYVRIVPDKGDNTPIFGVFATGKGGSALVKTEKGRAIMFDAGSGSSVRLAVYERELSQLLSFMGIKRVDALFLTHHHEDHTNKIVEVIKKFRIRAENLIISEYFSYKSGVREKIEKLANDKETRTLGYNRFQFLNNFELPLSNSKILEFNSREGNLIFEYLANKEDVEKLIEEVKKGKKPNSKIEDAASFLVKVSEYGKEFKMVILNDFRGINYKTFYEAMEINPGSFNRFFKDVKLVGGFQHHLGKVYDAADVEGISIFLKATVYRNTKLTVLVQTSDEFKRNNLIDALNILGVDVMTTTESTSDLGSGIVAKSNGIFEPYGTGSTTSYAEGKEAIEWYSKLLMLNENIDLLAKNGAVKQSDAEYNEFKKEIKKELDRVEAFMQQREKRSIETLKGQTAKDDKTSKINTEGIQINTSKILENKILQEKLNDYAPIVKAIKMFAELNAYAENLDRELRGLKTQKLASNELVNLIYKASPTFANEVLSRSRAISQVRFITELAIQARMNQALEESAGAGTPALRVFAWAALALELMNDIVLPAMISENNSKKLEFMRAYDVVLWWFEKNVPIKVKGIVNNATFDKDEEITELSEINKRISEGDIDGLEVKKISNENWDFFKLWLSQNIISYNDYATYFRDDKSDAFRHEPNGKENFKEHRWKYKRPYWRVGHISDNQDFEWVESNEFTSIMNELAARIINNTEIDLDSAYENRNSIKQSQPKLDERDKVKSPQPIHIRPKILGKARFKNNAAKALYSVYEQKEIIKEKEWWRLDDIDFFILEKSNYDNFEEYLEIPEEYTLVMGANYNTYANIRGIKNWAYSVKDVFKVERRHKTLFADELDRKVQELLAQGWIKEELPLTSTYEYFLHLPGYAPNLYAVGLVLTSSIQQTQ